MEGVDKGKMTKIHKETIILMDCILSGEYHNMNEEVTHKSPQTNESPSSI